MTNSNHVARFMAAWERLDLEAVMAAFAPDAVYHNIPMAPLVGHEAIRAFIAPFMAKYERLVFETHHSAENAAGVVMNERTDTFFWRGKTASMRIMGVFELKDGLILRWRDYYDPAEFVPKPV